MDYMEHFKEHYKEHFGRISSTQLVIEEERISRLLDDDEFCGMCGKKQNINMCTNCGAKFMVGNAFCTKCGYKVYSKIDELKKSNNKTIIKIIKAFFSVFRYIVSFFILLFAFIYIFSILKGKGYIYENH